MKHKLTMGLLLSFGIVIAFVTVMFLFSGQSGENSVNSSEKILDRVMGLLNLEELVKGYPEVYRNRNYLFRKSIHFTEYMILGILILNFLRFVFVKRKWAFSLTVLLCGIVSVIDETYQSFVPGRTPRITDVFIDMSGVLLGVLICMLFFRTFSTIKGKKS
jgi:VanZ family protein